MDRSFAILALVALMLACSGAKKGESCADEGRIGGDCDTGLMCARSNDDDVSELVCLKPCASDASCDEGDRCSGERGRNLPVCRSR